MRKLKTHFEWKKLFPCIVSIKRQACVVWCPECGNKHSSTLPKLEEQASGQYKRRNRFTGRWFWTKHEYQRKPGTCQKCLGRHNRLRSIAFLEKQFPEAKRIWFDGKFWHAEIVCMFCNELCTLSRINLDGGCWGRQKARRKGRVVKGERKPLSCTKCARMLKNKRKDVEPFLRDLFNQQRTTARLRGENLHDVVRFVIAMFWRKLSEGGTLSSPLSFGAIPVRCPYFKWLKLRIGFRKTGNLKNRSIAEFHNFVSVDRKNSEKGYDNGNVQWTSLRYNIVKSDMTPKERRAMGKS